MLKYFNSTEDPFGKGKWGFSVIFLKIVFLLDEFLIMNNNTQYLIIKAFNNSSYFFNYFFFYELFLCN